ncbi:YdcF family protein [Sinimarinibacterium sp. CAU 1509]|uniref:YdcF family protein n=1 Tax=Sinimarinibacterium sp. CAU 1509 TaxID=2562283 RepID=UPI0010AD8E29|nr:YdcF family protein [Sinimarinibacterium sp. CAU 1509]TJY59916.1 YdcF family protein [Sinimarinibacterium sp. CAU 1509]
MITLKILTVLLQPLGAALLALLFALLLWRRRVGLARGLTGAALVWLWLWSMPWASEALRASLEQRYPMRAPDDLPQADAIVLLGGGIEPAAPPRRLDVDVNSGGDRMIYTAALYHAGKAPLIIVSGGRLPWTPGTQSEADAMAALLQQLGVPDAAVLREGRSRTTRENARYTRDLLATRGIHRVLLVTSALHMPRSMRNFETPGVEFIAAPTDVEVVERAHGVLDLLPDTRALDGSARAFKEYLGLLHQAVLGAD